MRARAGPQAKDLADIPSQRPFLSIKFKYLHAIQKTPSKVQYMICLLQLFLQNKIGLLLPYIFNEINT